MGRVRVATMARMYGVDPSMLIDVMEAVGIDVSDRPLDVDTKRAVRIEQVLLGMGYVPDRRDVLDDELGELRAWLHSSELSVEDRGMRKLATLWGADLNRPKHYKHFKGHAS